ncbi:MAG: acetyl-CoA C-acetyltransferase [bacterium]
MEKKPVAILGAARTAIGTFGGMFKTVPANQLGVAAARAALERSGVEAAELGDVIVGHCMMRSDEINIARVISLNAGIPIEVPAWTVQRQCASGMQAVVSGMQQIWTGEHEVVLAGGVENMSRVPYVLKDYRTGGRMGNGEVVDMLTEALTDPLGGYHMGVTAENLAAEFGITREEQDELAYTSQTRAVAAIDEGRFVDEIAAVEVGGKRGQPPTVCDTDEHPRRGVSLEALAKLRPAFKKDGTVTAGNASGINDGAAMMVVAGADYVERTGKTPLAWIVDHQVAAVEPERMGFGPVPAVRKLLDRNGLALGDIDLIEVNEAFAAQYLACEKALELDRERTNVNGSGIALGHPVGATGCRITITLVHEMRRRGAKRGIATLCVGGGMGKALLIELP